MNQKELLVPLFIKNGMALSGFGDAEGITDDVVSLAVSYDHIGADALLIFDLSEGDAQHDASIGLIKEIARVVDIPLYGGGNIRRMEDVKKLIYAGCRKVFLNFSKESNEDLVHEVSNRFGKEKVLACVKTEEEALNAKAQEKELDGVLALSESLYRSLSGFDEGKGSIYCMVPSFPADCAAGLFEDCGFTGVAAYQFMEKDFPMMDLKHTLLEKGISVNTFESSLSWEELKLNSDGMVPVVVQDYKTQEVLMVAYMNQEAFETTVRTGRMTYWSRSRKELWVKGLTSGHFQYVKELRIDCDNDTLLAKVSQVGAACHTGNSSCFYRTIMKKEYDETNPLKVFEDVFQVILDRKEHPKEGSYTNYLFDKGIDKILKKVGEEATEIVIAAKNPDPEEIKYEISDFLYHVMVLMAQRGVTWEDITKELARR